jgi:ATP-binding cassette subfamily B multidrug efflux pump
MKSLRSLLPYFNKYKFKLSAGILFIIGANLFKTYNPVVVRDAINQLQLKLSEGGLGHTTELGYLIFKFSAIYFAVALVEGVFTFLMRQTIIVVSRNIEYDLKNKLYNHYQYLDQAFFRRHNTGDLMNRITEDVSRVRMFVGPSVMYTVNLVMMFIFCSYNMFRVSWELSLCVLIPMPILSFTIFKLNRKINKTSELLQAKLSDLTTMAQESYSGIRVIKSYVQEKAMGRFFEKESEDYKKQALYLAKIEAFYFPFILFLVGMCLLIIVFVGGYLQMQGKISTGNIAEFLLYLNMLTFPMSALGWAVALTQQAAVSMRRINEFLDEEPSVINTDGYHATLKGDIAFENMEFVYPDSGIKALYDINLHIKAGQKVAIVGKTGSGKTTLFDLIMRMYDVSKGNIKIDGIDVKNWKTDALREQIAYVPQDVFLFSDTIENNILFGNTTENDEANNLATSAAIHEEISQFDAGYKTLVGERGVTLSGGQKQRISIARALAGNPSVMLLDDCLSAVDANTEKVIEQNLRALTEGKTTIIITHRILTHFHFDQILVMDEGKIVEQGTHDSLLAAKGLYFSLYQHQNNQEKKGATFD